MLNNDAQNVSSVKKHLNSKNDKTTALKIKRLSAILMERNYLAYKELANK